jgi:hypothetical protein
MARHPRSRKASAAPQPGTFSARFSRVTSSKTAKRYLDRNTGQEISYRQALKRAKEGGLTRRTPSEEHKAKVKAGIARRASFRNSVLKRLKLTGADLKGDPKLQAYIKHGTAASKKGSEGFSNRNRINREQFLEDYDQDIDTAEDDYDDYMANRGPVGGFIRG